MDAKLNKSELIEKYKKEPFIELQRILFRNNCGLALTFIGGLDVSYSKDLMSCYVVIVIYDYKDFLNWHDGKPPIVLREMYFKSFFDKPVVHDDFVERETKLYKEMLDIVKEISPEFYPKLLLIDGYGNINDHNVATELGRILNMATIGIAKSYHSSLKISKDELRQLMETNCKNKGDYIYIKNDNGENICIVIKPTSELSHKYMYISVGHNIKLDEALVIVTNLNKTTNFKVIEPIRIADMIGRTKLCDENVLNCRSQNIKKIKCFVCDEECCRSKLFLHKLKNHIKCEICKLWIMNEECLAKHKNEAHEMHLVYVY